MKSYELMSSGEWKQCLFFTHSTPSRRILVNIFHSLSLSLSTVSQFWHHIFVSPQNPKLYRSRFSGVTEKLPAASSLIFYL